MAELKISLPRGWCGPRFESRQVNHAMQVDYEKKKWRQHFSQCKDYAQPCHVALKLGQRVGRSDGWGIHVQFSKSGTLNRACTRVEEEKSGGWVRYGNFLHSLGDLSPALPPPPMSVG